MTRIPSILHLRRGGTSVVVGTEVASLPQILYWGCDLGDLPAEALADLAAAQVPPVVSGTADVPPVLSLVPMQSEGWLGTPGLVGSRGGRGVFCAFRTVAVRLAESSAVEIEAQDDEDDNLNDPLARQGNSGAVGSVEPDSNFNRQADAGRV